MPPYTRLNAFGDFSGIDGAAAAVGHVILVVAEDYSLTSRDLSQRLQIAPHGLRWRWCRREPATADVTSANPIRQHLVCASSTRS